MSLDTLWKAGFDPSQRRHPKGNPEGGRWAPQGGAGSGAIERDSFASSEAYIREFLAMASAAHGGRPSTDSFILKYGRAFPTDAGSYVGGGRAHECFKNATLAVLADDSLTYVEGYIDVHGVPIHHAWAVDANGVVRDYTLETGKGIRGYFGVPMRTDYVLEAVQRMKYYGVLTHNQRGHFWEDPSAVVARLEKHTPGGHPHDQQAHAGEGGGSKWDKRTDLPKSLRRALSQHSDKVYDAFREEGDYWVYLRDGWINPVLEAGSIHERTVPEVVRQLSRVVREDAAKKAYNPSQPRHPAGSPEGGQWAPQGGVPTASPSEGASVEDVVQKVAEHLHFDASRITVDRGPPPEFELAGQKYKYAGAAHLAEGKITIYPQGFTGPGLEGVVAHEIMHIQFEEYIAAVEAERDAVMRDPGPEPVATGQYYWQRRGGASALMKPDGLLRSPYDTKYPLYQAHATREQEWQAFRDDDGVSDYSRSWWAEVAAGRATVKQAYHETLAEMARAHYSNGVIPGTPRWREYYKEVLNWHYASGASSTRRR